MAFSLMRTKISLTGMVLEDYTDELAIALNAINVRSSKDTAYVKQQCLFGTLIADKLLSTDEKLSTEDKVSCDDTLAASDTEANVNLITLDSLNSLDGKSADDLAKIFKVLVLYKYNCTGYLYDTSIDSLVTIFNKSQTFWHRYRLVNKHKLTLSKDMIETNIKLINVSKTFGASSGLDAQDKSISFDDGATCLFSENSQLNVKFNMVPINNGLPKLLNVQFNYTVCNIVSSKDL